MNAFQQTPVELVWFYTCESAGAPSVPVTGWNPGGYVGE